MSPQGQNFQKLTSQKQFKANGAPTTAKVIYLIPTNKHKVENLINKLSLIKGTQPNIQNINQKAIGKHFQLISVERLTNLKTTVLKALENNINRKNKNSPETSLASKK